MIYFWVLRCVKSCYFLEIQIDQQAASSHAFQGSFRHSGRIHVFNRKYFRSLERLVNQSCWLVSWSAGQWRNFCHLEKPKSRFYSSQHHVLFHKMYNVANNSNNCYIAVVFDSYKCIVNYWQNRRAANNCCYSGAVLLHINVYWELLAGLYNPAKNVLFIQPLIYCPPVNEQLNTDSFLNSWKLS